MKKVLLSMLVLATLGMSSCGGSDLCTCATETKELAKQVEEADDSKKEELIKQFDAKRDECKKIAKEMGEGKSNEEIKAMREDFDKNCESAKL